jgi:hypothetical protein
MDLDAMRNEIELLLENDEEEARQITVSEMIRERKSKLAEFDDRDIYDSEREEEKEGSSASDKEETSDEVAVISGDKKNNNQSSVKSRPGAPKSKKKAHSISSSSGSETSANGESDSETSSVDNDSDSFEVISSDVGGRGRKAEANSKANKPVLRTRKTSELAEATVSKWKQQQTEVTIEKTFQQKIQEREERKKRQEESEEKNKKDSKKKVITMELDTDDEETSDGAENNNKTPRMESNAMELEIAKSAGETWTKKSISSSSDHVARFSIDVTSPVKEVASHVPDIPHFEISSDDED